MLDEVFGGLAMVSGADQVPHGRVGVVGRQGAEHSLIARSLEEAEQGRLVGRGRDDQVGACGDHRQGDDRAIGVAGDVHGPVTHVLDQPREVGGILGATARAVAGLAAGMTAPVPHHDPIPLGQPGYRLLPVGSVRPGSMGQDEAVPCPRRLVVELDTVHHGGRHRPLAFRRLSGESRIAEAAARHIGRSPHHRDGSSVRRRSAADRVMRHSGNAELRSADIVSS
jgi:hypothetical protein